MDLYEFEVLKYKQEQKQTAEPTITAYLSVFNWYLFHCHCRASTALGVLWARTQQWWTLAHRACVLAGHSRGQNCTTQHCQPTYGLPL